MRIRGLGSLTLPGSDYIPETHYLPYGYGNCLRGGTHPFEGRQTGYSAQTATWFRQMYGRDPDPRFLADVFWACPGTTGYDDAAIGRALAMILAGGDPRSTPVRSAPGAVRPTTGTEVPAPTAPPPGRITFNTPGGVTVVDNGVVVTSPGGGSGAGSGSSGAANNDTATPPRAAEGLGGAGLIGLLAAGVGVMLLFKGN